MTDVGDVAPVDVAPVDVAPPGGWHLVADGRVGPPGPGELGVVAGGLSGLVGVAMRWLGRGQVPHVFRMLLRVPRLLVPWSVYASRLMPYGRIPPRWRELMILRVAWNCRCRYEWLQHLEIGYRVGLSPAEVLQVTHDPSGDPQLVALLRACDELHAERRLSDETYRALTGFLTEPLILEVLFLVGHYEGLAGLLNSTAVLPEAEVIAAARGPVSNL